MDCELPHLFDVRAGRAPLDDVRFVTPPFRPGVWAMPGKDLYGEPLEHHVEGVNFSVQWEGDDATEAIASAYVEELESAWTALVVNQGWPAPATSDQYLVRVILDPSLSGTGYTTTYDIPDEDRGAPVMYVNPSWWGDLESFSRSVAVHEFGHAIQYAVRDWRSSDAEAWFWEASAEWMAELGNPALDGYAYSAPYYAENTADTYDSLADAHQYGMFVLPAYLDETSEAFRATWADNVGGDWVDEIRGQTGEDFETTIGEMASWYVAGTLRESDLYPPPDVAGTWTGDTDVDVGLYGTTIYQVTAPVLLAVDGPGRLDFAVDGEVLDDAPTSGSFYALVTRNDDGDLRLVETDEPVAEGDDTGEKETDTGSGCATVAAPSAFSLLALATLRRRSPAR